MLGKFKGGKNNQAQWLRRWRRWRRSGKVQHSSALKEKKRKKKSGGRGRQPGGTPLVSLEKRSKRRMEEDEVKEEE